MYPETPIPGYAREEFIGDLIDEHELEVRNCLAAGAHCVQVDFTEGGWPSRSIRRATCCTASWISTTSRLARFSAEERRRLGVHTCPGGDRDSTHSADVDYADLLPSLFELDVRNFYIALAGERDRKRVLETIKKHMKPHHRIFIGVVAPIDPRVESSCGGSRSHSRSRRVHSGRPARNHRRLRLLPVLRRRLHYPGQGIREDQSSRAGHGARRRDAGVTRGRARRSPRRICCAPSHCKMRRAFCSRAAVPKRSWCRPRSPSSTAPTSLRTRSP